MDYIYPAVMRIAAWFLLIAAVMPIGAHQVADPTFLLPIDKPAYPAGKGPVVLIDEFHNNFHTLTGRYQPFADLRRRDAYVVDASAGEGPLAGSGVTF